MMFAPKIIMQSYILCIQDNYVPETCSPTCITNPCIICKPLNMHGDQCRFYIKVLSCRLILFQVTYGNRPLSQSDGSLCVGYKQYQTINIVVF